MDPVFPQDKRCSKCGEVKRIEDFYFKKDRHQYAHDCKQCVKARSRDYYRRINVPKPPTKLPAEKKCTKCQRVLPIDDFGRFGEHPHRRQSWCYACYREHTAQRNATADGKLKNRSRKLRRHGITVERYHEMFEAQGGVCACCHRPETHVVRGVVVPLSVDHNHETGEVRGLLCHQCNTAYGLLGEDKACILELLAYHRQHCRS